MEHGRAAQQAYGAELEEALPQAVRLDEVGAAGADHDIGAREPGKSPPVGGVDGSRSGTTPAVSPQPRCAQPAQPPDPCDATLRRGAVGTEVERDPVMVTRGGLRL